MDKNSDLKNIIIKILDLNKAYDIVSIDLKDKSSMVMFCLGFHYRIWVFIPVLIKIHFLTQRMSLCRPHHYLQGGNSLPSR